MAVDEDMLRAHAEHLGQALRAEREMRKAMRGEAERRRLALCLLGSKLASLHACIMLEPDGGCVDIDMADCEDRGCATCWAVWAEIEAGRMQERRRERHRAKREHPVDMDSYRLGAD